jgi:RNA recognition motif-containing protein
MVVGRNEPHQQGISHSSQDQMMEFYIGNLPRNVTTEEISRLFSPFGEIVKVLLLTDRTSGKFEGYAIMQMADKMTTTAVAQLARSSIKGRHITVVANMPVKNKEVPPQRVVDSPQAFHLKGKDLTLLRDEVAQLLPEDKKGNLDEAERFLSEIVRHVKDSINMKNNKLLALFVEAARNNELSIGGEEEKSKRSQSRTYANTDRLDSYGWTTTKEATWRRFVG